MDVVDVAPAAAVVGFEEGGKADVVEDAVPVEGKLEVAQRALVDLWRIFFVREEDGLRDGYAEFGGESEVEKFVVGGPPEGIVDDLRAGEDRIFQERPIEGHVVRDAIDDDRVAGGLVPCVRRRHRRTQRGCLRSPWR